MNQSADEIDALTGLRFLAAASIAVAHIGLNVDIGGFNLGTFAIIGMPLFFTLSGFVIHYVYGVPLSRGQGAMPFAIARFARLWSLFFAFYLWFALRTPFGDIGASTTHWAAMLAYLTLTFSWFPFLIEGTAPIQHYYGVSWSISTEVFFYVCYALGLHRIAGIRRVSTCLAALAGLCVGVVALMAVLYLTRDGWERFALSLGIDMPTRERDVLNSFYRWFLYVSPYMRIFEFIGGCLTCQLFLLVRQRPDLMRRLSAPAIAAAGALGVLALFGLYAWWTGRTAYPSLPDFLVTLHMNFLLAPACYVLFFGLAIGGSALGRALSTRVMVHLGTISYSIYLGHVVALSFLYVGPDHPSKGLGVLACFALTLAMSAATYALIEWPGRTILRRALTRLVRRPSSLAAAASGTR